MEILEELALDLPQSLKTFLIPQPIHKIRALRKRLRIITRWSEIQDTVGWIGVVISQFYNADTVIRQWNGKDFKKFLSGLRDFQPHLMERVMLYWPGIPNVLMSTNRMKKNHADGLGLEPSEPHKMINFLPEGEQAGWDRRNLDTLDLAHMALATELLFARCFPPLWDPSHSVHARASA